MSHLICVLEMELQSPARATGLLEQSLPDVVFSGFWGWNSGHHQESVLSTLSIASSTGLDCDLDFKMGHRDDENSLTVSVQSLLL